MSFLNQQLGFLPPQVDFDNIEILKALNMASRALAELKGETKTIPNSTILINTLSLQESKESSEIENIVTTQDDLFKSQLEDNVKNIAAKEVKQYAQALSHGYNLVRNQQLLTSNHILEIQQILEPNKPGFRRLMGTTLKNTAGDVIYTPPQNPQEIIGLMSNLDKYINIPELHNIDPLLKMTIIHHQFESIHPFYDGNGRTGRIINILYLVYSGLLDSLFKYPYTKIRFIEDDLGVHRQTAAKYLDRLVELKLLTSQKLGKSNYYINHQLFDLLVR